MTHLYEITEQHKELLKLADESDDMAQAVADTMEGIEASFDDKAISLITVEKNMEADVLAINSEIERLTKRKQIIVNKQNSMKEYLRINMEETGISKITCPLFAITLKKGRDIVKIQDEDKIPTDYLNIKTSVTPMKREILAELKAGNDVEGAILVKSKSSILIK